MFRMFGIACIMALFSPVVCADNILVLANVGDPSPDGDGLLGPITIFASNEGAAAYSGLTTGNSGGASRDFILATATWRGVEIVFREGDAAPGGGTFSGSLGQISVNSLGRAAFYGYMTGTSAGTDNNAGIFSGNGSSITQIARENQSEPMGGSGVFDSFGTPAINQSGQVAFWGAIRNAGTPLLGTHGIFIGNGVSLIQVARTHTGSPDGNGQFSSLSLSPKISNSGNVAFQADLSGTVGGSNDNTAIFMGNETGLTKIARENDLSPDGNGRLDAINFPWMNENNKVAFYTTLRGTGGGSTDNIAIFRGSGSELTKIARLGDAAPDNLGSYTGLTNTLSINSSGDVAFTAMLNTGTRGVFWGDGTKTETIALSGQAGPDGGYTFTDFTLAAINNTRTVAFQADLSYGTGSRGLYLGDGEETLLIAKVGDQLDGSTITQLGFDPKTFTNFQELAFQATLQDGRIGVFLFSPKVKWRHNGGGNWEDASRWTVSLRPGEYTQVEIDPAGGGTVSGPADDSTIRSLSLGLTSSNTAELNLKNTADLTVVEGVEIGAKGKLSGNGRIIGNLINGGEVAPGNSPGNIEIDGDFTQLSEGRLTLELGGATIELYDQLIATGNILLDGTLEVVLINGFALEAGMTFDLLRGGSITLDELNLMLPELSGGLGYEQNLISEGGEAVFQVAVVPEPNGIALFVAGLIYLSVFARRARSETPWPKRNKE